MSPSVHRPKRRGVFKHNRAFSFQIDADTGRKTAVSWDAIVGSGVVESKCEWCKDKWWLCYRRDTTGICRQAWWVVGDFEVDTRSDVFLLRRLLLELLTG